MVVHPDDGMLYSNTKLWAIETQNNFNELNFNVEPKKQVSRVM